jgi:hypothetical protein
MLEPQRKSGYCKTVEHSPHYWTDRDGREFALVRLETWAVEFHVGSYSKQTILEKLRSFSAGFDGQCWAVASEA